MNVYHFCADDLGVYGDLFVKAESKEKAEKKFKKYLTKEVHAEIVEEADLEDYGVEVEEEH